MAEQCRGRRRRALEQRRFRGRTANTSGPVRRSSKVGWTAAGRSFFKDHQHDERKRLEEASMVRHGNDRRLLDRPIVHGHLVGSHNLDASQPHREQRPAEQGTDPRTGWGQVTLRDRRGREAAADQANLSKRHPQEARESDPRRNPGSKYPRNPTRRGPTSDVHHLGEHRRSPPLDGHQTPLNTASHH